MDDPTLLSQRLLQSCDQNRHGLAIVDQQQSLTYRQLAVAIQKYQVKLRVYQLEKGTAVIVVGEKSVNMLVAMLACLYEDYVFIPLETQLPAKRMQALINQSQAGLLIQVGVGMSPLNGVRRIYDDAVLVYFSSGSAGQPKGIIVTENNMMSFVLWAIKTFGFQSSDRLAAFAPWHFDLSSLDIFAALLTGATIYCIPEKLKCFPVQISQWLVQHAITGIYMVPTVLKNLIKYSSWSDQTHRSLRCILFAGEPYGLPQLLQLRRRFPMVMMANLYGPTETNVCAWCQIPTLQLLETWAQVPIGKPLPGFKLMVAPASCKQVMREATEGELICSSQLLLNRYLNPDCGVGFFHDQGGRAYRTGDLVRRDHDQLVLIGRKDWQIKINGVRIDPHEIEGCLEKNQMVVAVAVALCQGKVTAFVVLEHGGSVDALAHHCGDHLPLELCPTQYHQLDQLPKTQNEKIDYKRLMCDELTHEDA